jgi:uncharacterized alpha-E superfamily protein
VEKAAVAAAKLKLKAAHAAVTSLVLHASVRGPSAPVGARAAAEMVRGAKKVEQWEATVKVEEELAATEEEVYESQISYDSEQAEVRLPLIFSLPPL